MAFIKFIGVICFAYLFVVAEPIEYIKDKLLISGMFRRLLDCAMCSGFWIGLIVYQDLWLASIVSLCAEATYRFYME